MKTRTLLLLSVATGLLILLAGGVFLFQLSSQSDTVAVGALGEPAQLGDVTVTVVGAIEVDDVLAVEIEVGGVEDGDGPQDFRLVTGDRRLAPASAPADGRCVEYTVETRTCRLDFDVSSAGGSSRAGASG